MLLVSLNNHRDNLYMVQEVDSPFLSPIVLNHTPAVNISLQILDIVLNVLRLMGDGEIEDVVA